MLVIGQEDIADLFGVAPKTIVEWQESGFPVAVRGGPGVPSEYDSQACIAWLVGRELRKVQSEGPADRLARVKADAIEMDNAVKRQTLIPADRIEPRLKAAKVFAIEAWRNEPARLAREVTGKDAQEAEDILAEAFDAYLVRLSRWPESAPFDGQDARNPTIGSDDP